MILFKHPLILLSNIVKVGGIWLADTINWLWNPFDKFTRPVVLKRTESLDSKAIQFETELNKFYDQEVVYNSTINWDGTSADQGDQALWHGVTVAMRAIKYSVTKDPNDLEKVREGMTGLLVHQTAALGPARRLIRGVTNPAYPHITFIDDVSNDGATGHLLGIYYAWKYGDANIKAEASNLIKGLADEILNNNYCLIGPTGAPTTYGTLINGWLTNPMCLTLCMAILLTASTITEDNTYLKAYWDVKDIYGSAGLYKYPKVSFLTWNNWNDDHRAAIHLSILADLDVNNHGYIKGLKRIWRLNKNTGNAWVAYLCGKHFDIKNEIQPCITLLNESYVEDFNNVQKINSENATSANNLGIEINAYSIASFMQGQFVSTQPLPRWRTGAQDFRYQRCPYSVDDWVGNATISQWFFGVDFLISYWGFKQIGWL